tara:strand:+ start:1243 stop:1563 length:321 start_codon:yes stop_codon:yes gene_type:complete
MIRASDNKPTRPTNWTQEEMNRYIDYWLYNEFDSPDMNPSCQDDPMVFLRELEEQNIRKFRNCGCDSCGWNAEEFFYYRIASLKHLTSLYIMFGKDPDYFLKYLTY